MKVRKTHKAPIIVMAVWLWSQAAGAQTLSWEVLDPPWISWEALDLTSRAHGYIDVHAYTLYDIYVFVL
jgi:hypothetical protein